jgi:hypothetical protein
MGVLPRERPRKKPFGCYLEGLEKVNEIKAKPGALAREVNVAL